jgi:tetratricopeptide (TPR) repeat protein
MRRDSLAFAISGTLFGLLVGWIIGAQQATPSAPSQAPAPAAAAAPATQPPPFDAVRATELERQASAEPSNAAVRVNLGDLYFDAERYQQAATWYEAALKLDPKNVNASTDLGVAYFSSNQVDRALAQFQHSLSIDPRHVKTLLNQGIVRAFGKQDLAGAAESWQRVVEIAPDSEEGRRAQQGLDGLKNAHQAGASDGAPQTEAAGEQ